MVGAERPVFVISNDVVPGLGMPVAAPGLRAFGLAEGLRANGLKVRTLVVKGFVERQWARFGKPVPYPTAPGTEIVGADRLARYLESHAPADVILINSNQVDHLKPIKGIRYVLDFFAPKMLETLYQHGDEGYPKKDLKALRRRKIRAINMSDAFIVNGSKKVPYFLAWILQSDRDVRRLPLEVVNMCAPPAWSAEPRLSDGGVGFAMTGYLQSWSALDSWVRSLEKRLDQPGVRLDLLLPWHWGGRTFAYESKADLDRLGQHESVTTHDPMNFAGFRRFLSTMDVSVDLFKHNLEREYAMVTRSVISLSCGVPVIHPPFTEVSPLIAEYDAGWILDPADAAAFGDLVDSIAEDPAMVVRKKENARALASAVLDPAVAVEPLARILREAP